MPRRGQKASKEPSVLTGLCSAVDRCRLLLAEVPKITYRNAELKLRLRLWEAGDVNELISKMFGQQHSGPLRRRKRVMQPQTDEQRGKRACAMTARGSIISKAMKGLVGGAAQGSADCRKNWTAALNCTELGQRNSSHHCRACRGGAGLLGAVEKQRGAQ